MRLTVGQVYALAIAAGFTGEAARQATAIALHESGGPPYTSADPGVVNTWDSNAAAGIPSKGLMQIIEPTKEAAGGAGLDLLDPAQNMRAAYLVSKGGTDWSPWAGGWNGQALAAVDAYLAANPTVRDRPAAAASRTAPVGLFGDAANLVGDPVAGALGAPKGTHLADWLGELMIRAAEIAGGAALVAFAVVELVKIAAPGTYSAARSFGGAAIGVGKTAAKVVAAL